MTSRPSPAPTSDLAATPLARRMFWLVGAAFWLMGLLQASYGPSFAGFEARFGVDETAVARIYSATFSAMFLSILASGWLLSRLGPRGAVRLALALLLLGLALMAPGLSWALLLAGALVAGLGYGLMTVVGNFSLAQVGARARMNLANALFGLGSILAPLAVSALAGRGVTVLYGLLALLVLVVLLLSGGFPARLGPAPQAPPPGGRPPLALLALFNLLLFLYVALEVSAGGWMARHLAPGYGLGRATALVSLFWVAYTLGRVLSAPLAQRLAPGRLAGLCLALCLLCALLTALPALRLPAYVLLGFVMAPVYMAVVAWLVGRVPQRFANLGLLGSGIGAAFGPPLVGLLLARSGVAAIAPALAAFALLGLLVVFMLHRLGRAAQPAG